MSSTFFQIQIPISKSKALRAKRFCPRSEVLEVKLREKRVKFVLQHDRLQASHTHDSRTVGKNKVTRKSFVNLLVPTTCCSLRHRSFCCRKFWLKPTTVIFLVMCLWGANYVFCPRNPLQSKVLTQGLKIVGWSLSEHICSTRYLNPKLGYPHYRLKMTVQLSMGDGLFFYLDCGPKFSEIS